MSNSGFINLCYKKIKNTPRQINNRLSVWKTNDMAVVCYYG